MHPMQEDRFPKNTPLKIRILTNVVLILTIIAITLWIF